MVSLSKKGITLLLILVLINVSARISGLNFGLFEKTYGMTYEQYMYGDRITGGGNGNESGGGGGGGGSVSESTSGGEQGSGGGGQGPNGSQSEEEKAQQAAEEAARLEAEQKLAEEAAKAQAEKEAAEKRAKEASDAAAEAQKALTQIENEIESLKKELGEDQSETETDSTTNPLLKFISDDNTTEILLSDDYISATEEGMQKFLKKAKKESLEKQKDKQKKTIKEKFEEMGDAFSNLADKLRNLIVTGDPVEIGTGNFIAEYTDFTAQDYLNKFTVQRNHNESLYSESYGRNWNCSLDTRIIRTYEAINEELLERCIRLQYRCTSAVGKSQLYIETYKDFPTEEIKANRKYASVMNLKLSAVINFLNEKKNEKERIIEKNKYVGYGKYSNILAYMIPGDVLLYVDKRGHEYQLFENEKGEWRAAGGLAEKKFYLIKKDGEKFEVIYDDGTKISYNEYGLMESETDMNGNQVKYKMIDGKIGEIVLKTGEILQVSRNSDGCITKISGSVSGTTEYSYLNGRVKSVKDNNGITVNYSYDENGDLTKITKADGTEINIGYLRNYQGRRSVCTSVTNEIGETETFSYDFTNHTVKHTGYNGIQEEFGLSDKGLTVSHNDGKGNVTKIESDEYGFVTSIQENGITKNYSYDSNYKLGKVGYSDGSYESMSYNENGKLLSRTDRDRFTTHYTYDSKGNITGVYYCENLVSLISYYSNGLVKSVTENGITYNYEYNDYGSIVKKWWTDSYGKNCRETWNYDLSNRVIKHIGVDGTEKNYSHTSESVTEKDGNGKQTQIKYNKRKWITRLIEKDLKTGKSVDYRYEYDGKGQVKEIYQNDKLYKSFAYNEDGQITSEKLYGENADVYAQEYLFDSYGFLTGKNAALGNESVEMFRVKYNRSNNSTQAKIFCGENEVCNYTYDNLGRLVKVVKNDGYTKNYDYSKAGRIISERDSNGVEKNYSYFTDGSVLEETIRNGKTIQKLKYDSRNNLVEITDALNGITEMKYDSYGRLILQKNEKKSVQIAYDMKNRKVCEVILGKDGKTVYEKRIVYDDENHSRTEYAGGLIKSVEYLDAWNRVVKRVSSDGEFLYDYDWNGNVIKVVNPDGTETKYEYSALGNVTKSKTGDSVKTWKWNAGGRLTDVWLGENLLYKAEYDIAGRILKETNNLGNEKEYGYSENGILSFINRYDTGKTEIKKLGNGKILSTDGNGNEYSYEVGDDGKVCKETDFENNVTSYQYDLKGRKRKKIFGSGLVAVYDYFESDNALEIDYSNGEKLKVWKNLLGEVTRMQNDQNVDEFDYDTGGRIVQQRNVKTGSAVDYKYDEFGRCIKKSGENFDVCYEYDNCGRVNQIKDLVSGAEVLYEYDANGKITEERYSNGLVVCTRFDEKGRKCEVVGKNRAGMEVWNEKILYDSNNRVKGICDKDGNCWEYEYDEKGRLVKYRAPYSQEQAEVAKAEAEECGLGINERENFLEGSENADVWEETYEYTPNGSIKSVTNPFGKIVYEYDKMNRLTFKHAVQTKNGMRFKWNKNNCLETVESALRKITFEYGALQRAVLIKVEDFVSGETGFVEYGYDCLGRRVKEVVNGVETVFVYDGMTNNVICSTVVTDGGRVLSLEKSDKFFGNENNYDFKWIDSKDYTENDSGRGRYPGKGFLYGSDSGKTTAAVIADKDGMRPRTTIYSNNKAIVNTYFTERGADGECQKEFLIRNWKGNTAATFDENGDCVEKEMFDLWGRELVNTRNCGFGNGVKHSEIQGFMLMDLGMRDYVPELKCFTTVDGARDGGNWFAYCACDPVNYEDEGGNFKTCLTEEEKAMYAKYIAEIGKFDKDEYLEKGESVGILQILDCADVSSMIDKIVLTLLGIDTTSKKQSEFNKDMDDGNVQQAKDDVQAKDFYEDDGSSYTKTGDIGDITNPDKITPGTVLVFEDDPTTIMCENHTLTVTAVDYDDNGNVVGISYIEGHTGGGKTETGYMDFSKSDIAKFFDGVFTLSAWRGKFAGMFEIEGNGEKTEKNCGK